MLTIENLHKSFSGKEILHGIDLNIDDGHIVGFIGPNGAGKTTTLRSVVGILTFEEGTITINHHDIKKDPVACKKEIAYLPDNPTLYETMTGNEYINFIADIFEVPNEKRKPFLEDLGNRLEIYENLNDPISTLSHGMKQKVAILAALIHEPKLLVMDEPFVGLDPKATHILKEEMKRMCKEDGCSILFSSHVLEVVQNLCDDIAMIKNGSIIVSGKLEDIVSSGISLEDYFLEMDESHEQE